MKCHQLFDDAQGRTSHPAQVVRVGWLTQVVAMACDALCWWDAGPRLEPSFQASFSRSRRTLQARKLVLPVRIPARWVLRPLAERPDEPQGTSWRQWTDRYSARNPTVSVNSVGVNP